MNRGPPCLEETENTRKDVEGIANFYGRGHRRKNRRSEEKKWEDCHTSTAEGKRATCSYGTRRKEENAEKKSRKDSNVNGGVRQKNLEKKTEAISFDAKTRRPPKATERTSRGCLGGKRRGGELL